MAKGEWPSRDTQFKPGNRQGGRPVGSLSLTGKLREMLQSTEFRGQKLPRGKTVGDVLLEVIIQESLKGKYPFAREVLDRIEGKVADRLEVSDARGVRELAEEIRLARESRAHANGSVDH